MGGPGDAAAVIAVGGGDEDHVLRLLPHLGRGEQGEIRLVGVEAQLLTDHLAHGEDAAEALEGVEAELGEALRFVLDVDAPDAQLLRKAAERDEGRGTVKGQRPVEAQDPGGLFGRQIGAFLRQRAVFQVGLQQADAGCFIKRFHEQEPPRCLSGRWCGQCLSS
jgi:hypothetical protein